MRGKEEIHTYVYTHAWVDVCMCVSACGWRDGGQESRWQSYVPYTPVSSSVCAGTPPALSWSASPP